MLIFAISDFHGQVTILEKLKSRIAKTSPHLIVFSGDVVKGYARGNEWLQAKKEGRMPDRNKTEIKQEEQEDLDLYQSFYNSLDQLGIPIMPVPGNMDAPEERFFAQVLGMQWENIQVVHENITRVGDFIISGCGGEITEEDKEGFFVLQYPRREVEFGLRRMGYISGAKILLFHSPPVSRLDLEEGKHKGSAVVNKLIAKIEPQFAFCGHAHKAQGQERIGKTLVINPGALKAGNYALVDTAKTEVKFGNLLS